MSFGAVAASVAGAAVGGMMGGGGGGGGGGEVNKAPWDPAIKPLINSVDTGRGLETYYQQNPLNPLQRVGYQNLFADLDHFRNVMAPQAVALNNRMMNTNYQRKPAGTELGGAFNPINAAQFLPPEQRQPQGGMGSGISMGGGLAGVMNGLGGMQGLGSMGSAASMLAGQGGMPGLGGMGAASAQLGGGEIVNTKPLAVASPGLLSGGGDGMSAVAPNSQSYGLLNWQELNPFTATNGIPKTPPPTVPDEKTIEELVAEEVARRERARYPQYGGD